MSHAALRRLLIGLELFLALGAFYGSISLLNDPTGRGLHLPIDVLKGTPFDTFLVPAIILFGVNGMVPLVTVIATVMGFPWAKYGHVAVGALLTGWMLGQGVLVGFSAPIQYVYLVLGFAILGLGLLFWNQERPGHGDPMLPA